MERRNITVADELGHLREEMRRLKAREAALREALIGGASRAGMDFTVELRRQRRRSFKADRLPAEIRADPRYWDETETITVATRRQGPQQRGEDEIVLIEPF